MRKPRRGPRGPPPTPPPSDRPLRRWPTGCIPSRGPPNAGPGPLAAAGCQGRDPQREGGEAAGRRPGYGRRLQGRRPGYGRRLQGRRPGHGRRLQGRRPGYGRRLQGRRPGHGRRLQGRRPGYGRRLQGRRPGYGRRLQGRRLGYGRRPLRPAGRLAPHTARHPRPPTHTLGRGSLGIEPAWGRSRRIESAERGGGCGHVRSRGAGWASGGAGGALCERARASVRVSGRLAGCVCVCVCGHQLPEDQQAVGLELGLVPLLLGLLRPPRVAYAASLDTALSRCSLVCSGLRV